MNYADGFYTMKGYTLQEDGKLDGKLSSAMEDYLEMIARIHQQGETVTITSLSKLLHVKASSATKMVQQLAQSGFVNAEKYGDIFLTDIGYEVGDYLLYRHDVLHNFLCLLNNTNNELEQAEKIEHFLDERTVKNMELLNQQLLNNSSIRL
jgi:Mn-dependent DtxR family transcriptional regulator